MRWTPAWMIGLGIFLIVYSWLSIGTPYALSQQNARVHNAARQAVAAMPEEELRRVFEVPKQVTELEPYMTRYFGGDFLGAKAAFFGFRVFELAGLGLVLLVWGVAESRARRRPAPAVLLPT